MHLRTIRQEGMFDHELSRLFSDAREADEILEGAIWWFSTLAELGDIIADTDIWYKIVPDLPHSRFLVMFYTMNEDTVFLHSIKAFTA